MTTLFLTDWKTDVSLASHHLVIRDITGKDKRSAIQKRIPLSNVQRAVIVGKAHVSMAVIRELMLSGIPVVLVTRGGRLLGTFAPARDGDAEQRVRQYQKHDSEWSHRAAISLIRAKLLNMRRVLQKQSSNRASATLSETMAQLKLLVKRAEVAGTADELRGLEGIGSAMYFQELSAFFPKEMPFSKRSRRPPRDPANALLSWVYTLVHGEVRCAVASQGLDPCLGVLHRIFYNRPSLSLDLLEPVRAPFCDLLVLRLLNLKLLQASHFSDEGEEHGFRLTEPGMKQFFKEYQKRLERPFKSQAGGPPLSARTAIRNLARDYAEALASGGNLSPFIMP